MTAVLDTTIPAGLDADGMTPAERRQYETLRAHRVQALLMQRVPLDIPIWSWTITAYITGTEDPRIGVEVQLNAMPSDHAKRAAVMGLAEQFGLDYAEKPHLGENIISATGHHDGVVVRFWQMVKPCNCGCGGTQ